MNIHNIDALVQEIRNSIANALELRFLALTHRYVNIIGDAIIRVILIRQLNKVWCQWSSNRFALSSANTC